MGSTLRHLWEQRRGLAATARFLARSRGSATPAAPGPAFTERVAPPREPLIRDFVRFTRGDIGWYRGTLPPHLFPHWCLPLMLRVASELPYPPAKVINVGCSMQVLGPIPRDIPLELSGQLVEVLELERFVSVVIGVSTAVEGECRLRSELQLRISRPRDPALRAARATGAVRKPAAERARVPLAARELQTLRLGRYAGRDFAELTGDFNPIHWLAPVARKLGFPGVILHGFGSFALAFDGLSGAYLGGNPGAIAALDARFEQPLVLPARVGLYLAGDTYAIGDGPGGRSYVLGKLKLND
jgi:acyl dehydratase